VEAGKFIMKMFPTDDFGEIFGAGSSYAFGDWGIRRVFEAISSNSENTFKFQG
jgi:hypothetical protein